MMGSDGMMDGGGMGWAMGSMGLPWLAVLVLTIIGAVALVRWLGR